MVPIFDVLDAHFNKLCLFSVAKLMSIGWELEIISKAHKQYQRMFIKFKS
jgi:hypothetical protein